MAKTKEEKIAEAKARKAAKVKDDKPAEKPKKQTSKKAKVHDLESTLSETAFNESTLCFGKKFGKPILSARISQTSRRAGIAVSGEMLPSESFCQFTGRVLEELNDKARAYNTETKFSPEWSREV